jgi:hypothetical protein
MFGGALAFRACRARRTTSLDTLAVGATLHQRSLRSAIDCISSSMLYEHTGRTATDRRRILRSRRLGRCIPLPFRRGVAEHRAVVSADAGSPLGWGGRGAWRSLVSALVWGTRGPEFESRRPD